MIDPIAVLLVIPLAILLLWRCWEGLVEAYDGNTELASRWLFLALLWATATILAVNGVARMLR